MCKELELFAIKALATMNLAHEIAAYPPSCQLPALL